MRLKHVRVLADLTQMQLQYLTGVQQCRISGAENATVRLREWEKREIEKVLRRKVEWELTERGVRGRKQGRKESRQRKGSALTSCSIETRK